MKSILSENLGILMVNRTLITLVRKVKAPSNMTVYKPICLCNIVCKIASKTVVNRLKSYFPSSISHNQSVCPGKLITYNVLVALELFDPYNEKQIQKLVGHHGIRHEQNL